MKTKQGCVLFVILGLICSVVQASPWCFLCSQDSRFSTHDNDFIPQLMDDGNPSPFQHYDYGCRHNATVVGTYKFHYLCSKPNSKCYIAKSHNDRIYRGCYVEPSSGPNLCKVEGNICCDSDYCNTAALVASNNYTKMLALVVAGLFAHIRF